MFVKGECSPRKEDTKVSCLKKKTLLSVAKILNKQFNAKIKLKKTTKKKLYSEIKKYLSKSRCEKESCWITLDLISKNLNENEKAPWQQYRKIYICIQKMCVVTLFSRFEGVQKRWSMGTAFVK